MKTINLFFDFEFTSLSPDAQPISLGIVSNPVKELVSPSGVNPIGVVGYESKQTEILPSQSIYAEFSDFDINRCDDWVKENVVKKLQFYNAFETTDDFKKAFIKSHKDKVVIDNKFAEHHFYLYTDENIMNELEVMPDLDTVGTGSLDGIRYALKIWLSKFKDYQIQFVADCSTYDWFWMLQLIGKWEMKTEETFNYIETVDGDGNGGYETWYLGLPKLPENISPIVQDLNDLIAYKEGISIKEAFDLNRENYLTFNLGMDDGFGGTIHYKMHPLMSNIPKHNSLWDAKVTKEIFNKLNK